MNTNDIMDNIHKLAIELSQTSDKKQVIHLINKINILKNKILDTKKEIYTPNALDLVGRYGT